MRNRRETWQAIQGQGAQPFAAPCTSPKFRFAFADFRATLAGGQVVVPETKTGRRMTGKRRTDRRSLCRRKFLSLSLSLHSQPPVLRSPSRCPSPSRSNRPTPANTNNPETGVGAGRRTRLSDLSQGRALALAPVVCLMLPQIQEGIRC